MNLQIFPTVLASEEKSLHHSILGGATLRGVWLSTGKWPAFRMRGEYQMG